MPISKETPMNEVLVQEDFSAANELALATLEQNERVTALAHKLNYQGSTDPGALENSARDAVEYLGKSIYMLGTCLMLLKEASGHGDFLSALGRLSVEPRSAQRYMAMAQRFSNTSMSTHLEKLGFSKMTELLPLDDEQIADLTELGQTGELDLDDVSTMSVKQLRAAVRKERAETDKQKNQVTRLTTVNTELHEEARLVKRLKPNEALAQIKAEAGVVLDESLGMVRGRLRQALVALNDAVDHPSKATFMAGLVGQMQAEIAALRDEFNLPDAVGDGTPEWERWAQANPIAAAATN